MKRIDDSFNTALVLLGIVAAAEFAYAPTLQIGVSSTDTASLSDIQKLVHFTFMMSTIPFFILILVWLLKELVLSNRVGGNLKTFTTLFCWDFWSFSLFAYLVVLYSLMQKAVISYSQSYGVFVAFLALAIFLFTIVSIVYRNSENITRLYAVYAPLAGGIAAFVALVLLTVLLKIA